MPKPLATALLLLSTAFALGACASSADKPAPQPATGMALPSTDGVQPNAQPGMAPLPPQGAVPAHPLPAPDAPGSAPMAGIPAAPGNAGAGTCNASAATFLVGQLGTSVAIDRAQQATGAKTVRILYPNQPITQEFIPGRLDLVTDEQNRITTVRCG
ncbi:hypothetical protein LQ948_06410 [Jiella sp. MQZ9-1]|uniref:Peptidase inhibitor I78 family protein n=1 Tax=Jiella flava TaxID=2816857 RepID=A0A939FUS5_9HYPH|nr:I78 family peptidase inhibitor [Jiella flava]MBO0662333.1 hypothetical protein [Jiella flava]MCD2470838.1 hypothetical protein [Jiella flava]